MRKLIIVACSLVAACETVVPLSPPAAIPQPPSCTGVSGCITTVIGYGANELPVEMGAPGYKTPMSQPLDMTVAANGDVYFVDWNNHMIRVLDAKTQTTRTIAGTGEIGDLGAGGAAVKARLNHPTDMHFAADGSLLLASWHNSKIKKIDLVAGVITDVCGTGGRAFAGDGGPAAKAVLDLPSAIVIDAKGTLYIADQANMRIRTVDSADKITTYLGDRWVTDTGKKDGLAKVDEKGRFVDCKGTPTADAEKFQIYTTLLSDGTFGFKRWINPAGKEVPMAIPLADKCPSFGGDGGTVAQGGVAWQASQSAIPNGKMAIDKDNDLLYLADSMNHRIRKIDLKTGIISSVAGNGTAAYAGDGGPALAASLNAPLDLDLLPDGSLVIADTFNHCVRKVDPQGKITTFAGTCGSKGGFEGDGAQATAAKLKHPYGVAVDRKSGRVFIADTRNHRIRAVEP